jgi:3-hydroxybutyrate dehydrogenase
MRLLVMWAVQIVHPVESFPFAGWKKMLAIDLDGAVPTTRGCFPHLKVSADGAASSTWAQLTRSNSNALTGQSLVVSHGWFMQ